MAERTGVITMKGNPLTLAGQEVKVGARPRILRSWPMT